MLNFLQLATQSDIVKRSLIVAFIVGSLLNVINQGDALMGDRAVEWGKCVLTYLVPYCVSTYGSVGALMKVAANDGGKVGAS